ncbi:MAG: hypothetical protein V4864_13475 [Pseudomonadota bacterium]
MSTTTNTSGFAGFLQRANASAATVAAIVGAISATFAILAQQEAMQSNRAQAENERKLKEMSAAIARNSDARADRESYFKLDQFVYQEMVKLFELPDSTSNQVRVKKEAAITGLVMAMASEGMKGPLTTALSLQLTNPTLKEATAKAADYYKLEDEKRIEGVQVSAASTGRVPASKSLLASMKVDLFYCEQDTSPEASKAKAEAIILSMNTSGNHGHWRLRSLPQSVNDVPGMRVKSPQVRFNLSENELPPAQELVELLNREFGNGYAAPVNFNTQQVTMRSPGYLSAFLCGLPARSTST